MQDISDKMRVPKRIKATGEVSDEDHLLSNQNGIINSWNYSNKIDMNVPDRIVVLGQDQHLGTRSAPREIVLEDSILPKDPGFVRVQTPPRVITLSAHHFPTVTDETPDVQEYSPKYESNSVVHASQMNGFEISPHDSSTDHQTTSNSTKKSVAAFNDTQISLRDDTPPLGEMLTPSEEVLHLRRQIAKLNRRMLSIEIDNVQRQQREKVIYCLGLAYFLLKAIFWLNRN